MFTSRVIKLGQHNTVTDVETFTFTAPAVLVHVISRRTDARERAGSVHTTVLTQKLREAALVYIYRKFQNKTKTLRLDQWRRGE